MGSWLGKMNEADSQYLKLYLHNSSQCSMFNVPVDFSAATKGVTHESIEFQRWTFCPLLYGWIPGCPDSVYCCYRRIVFSQAGICVGLENIKNFQETYGHASTTRRELIIWQTTPRRSIEMGKLGRKAHAISHDAEMDLEELEYIGGLHYDWELVLRDNPSVERIVENPIIWTYRLSGVLRRYSPPYLVSYLHEWERWTCLYDVQSIEALRKNWRTCPRWTVVISIPVRRYHRAVDVDHTTNVNQRD